MLYRKFFLGRTFVTGPLYTGWAKKNRTIVERW